MLPIIQSTEPFRLMAIDPGSSNLGFSMLTNDFENGIIVDHVETLNLKTNDPKYKAISEYQDDRNIRLIMLRDLMTELLNEHQPHAVVAESNYMGRFANGFAALVECVLVTRTVLYEYDPFIPLFMVDPTTVKTNIGMKRVRGTTKDDVKDALIKSKKVDWQQHDPKVLDEHSIDSVAIGVWYMENML